MDWDYQEALESKVLTDRKEFLNGYISGLLDSFGASAGEFALPSARTGTVKKLSEETAQKLAKLLSDLLHSHVKAEHRRLLNAAEVSEFHCRSGTERARSQLILAQSKHDGAYRDSVAMQRRLHRLPFGNLR